MTITYFNKQRNDEILLRFDKVNSEKEKLKNDIEELRNIRYSLFLYQQME